MYSRSLGRGRCNNTPPFGRRLVAHCAALRSEIVAAAPQSPPSPELTAKLHAVWLAELSSLQVALNDATVALPGFDVRKAQASIDRLTAEAQEARARLCPARKFTFQCRAKREAAKKLKVATAATTSVSAVRVGGGDSAVGDKGPRRASFDEDEHTIEGKTGEIIVVGAEAVRGGAAGVAGSIRLLNLRNCAVLVAASTRAIRVDGLFGCLVITVHPVDGSVLLHDCSGCTFLLASRQIRIHRSHACDYYLSVSSRPIIEHCTRLRFAPLDVGSIDAADSSRTTVPVEPSQLSAAAAPPEPAAMANDMWRHVDDFGWLK